ncbi:MAG: hypothetical protein KAT57_05445, partial [Candidatus Lokiarchaeota archaeon]|nr:hypothetical protein [Candidatus Lokiarchaeota archaeon]
MSKISKNSKTKKNGNKKQVDNRSERRNMTDEEIANIDIESKEVKQLMIDYQEETDKYSIWRGSITEGFKKWLKGEKIY